MDGNSINHTYYGRSFDLDQVDQVKSSSKSNKVSKTPKRRLSFSNITGAKNKSKKLKSSTTTKKNVTTKELADQIEVLKRQQTFINKENDRQIKAQNQQLQTLVDHTKYLIENTNYNGKLIEDLSAAKTKKLAEEENNNTTTVRTTAITRWHPL